MGLEVHQGEKETQAEWDLLGPQDYLVSLEYQPSLVHQGHCQKFNLSSTKSKCLRVKTKDQILSHTCKRRLDQWDPEVLQENVVPKDLMERWDRKVNMETAAQLELQDPRVSGETEEGLEEMVSLVWMDSLVVKVLMDLLEQEDYLEFKECLASKGTEDGMG